MKIDRKSDKENKKAAGACCHKKSDKTSKTKIWFIRKKRVFPALRAYIKAVSYPRGFVRDPPHVQ